MNESSDLVMAEPQDVATILNILYERSFEIFNVAGNEASKNANLLPADKVGRYSDEYIRGLNDAIESLRDLMPNDDVKFQSLQQAGFLASFMGKILLSNPEISLGYELMEFNKTTSFNLELDEETKNLIDQIERKESLAEECNFYWNAVVFKIFAGDFKVARGLLGHHSKSSTSEAFSILINALGLVKNEWFTNSSGINKFIEWRNELKIENVMKKFKSENNLQMIVDILTGDKDAIKKLSRTNIENWIQTLGALCMFVYPKAGFGEIETICEEAMSCFENYQMDDMDKAQIAVLKGDITTIAEIGWLKFNASWLAHYFDLIYKTTPSIVVVQGVNLRDQAIKAYANELFDGNCIELAIKYYEEAKLPNFEEILRTKIKGLGEIDENAALSLLNICKSLKMNDCVVAIATKSAEKLMDEGKENEALTWALRSKETNVISQVCGKMLDFADVRTIGRLDVLRNNNDDSKSPHFSMLRYYQRFLNSFEEKDFGEAAKHMVLIILSNHCSTKFLFVLIKYLTVMLYYSNSENVVLLSKDTCYRINEFLIFFECDLKRKIEHSNDIALATGGHFNTIKDLEEQTKLIGELLIDETSRSVIYGGGC